jgi:hypothetical protein
MDNKETEAAENELSEFHRDYLIRWMEYELKRQERTSESFQKERADRNGGSTNKDAPQSVVGRL